MSRALAKSLLKPLLANVLCVCLLAGSALSAAGQARGGAARRGATPPPAKTAAGRPPAVPTGPRCQGGWRGVVRFRKVLKHSYESDEPGIRKAKDRIRHKTSRDYDYAGQAVVDGSDPRNVVATSRVTFTDTDLHWGEERVWESCGSRGDTSRWQIIQSTDDRQTQARAEGAAEHFYLSVNEANGAYAFSFRFPEAKGVEKREQRVRRSGFCQPRNNQPFDKSDSNPTTVSGEVARLEDGRIDPENPDVLSGSKSWDSSSGAVKSFIYQVSWHFTRCPQQLLITDLKFRHPKYPDFEDWRDVDPAAGTIDGNRVKVIASVLNLSGETKYATLKLAETYRGDQWNGARPDEPLPEGETSVRLEGGEARDVEFVWNTEGQSWFDDGRPHLLHRIKAELSEAGQKRDEKTKPLHIAPKPLVLVHGLWSSAQAWVPLYQNLLTASHSYQWKAYAVGERPERGRMNTGGAFMSADKTNSIYENADELAKYVRFAQEDANAWHVDIVAHSMGGLISRLYVHKLMADAPDGAPLVKHLVMLGTPNAGSPCADVMDMKFRAFGERVQAIKELKPSEVAVFNQHVRDRKRVKFSALAGNSLPVMCRNVEWNDGVVSVSSAISGVEDHAFSNDIHTELTNARNFGNFVLPHLVTGPRGSYPVPVRSDPTPLESFENIEWGFRPGGESLEAAPAGEGAGGGGFGALFVRASARIPAAGPQGDGPAEPFTAEVRLAPKQVREVEVPVAAGPNFGLTIMAAPSVSATLFDEAGATVGRNTANLPRTNVFFRSIFVGGPVRGGVWKLRLENTSTADNVVLLASWADAAPLSFTVAAEPAGAAGQVALRATLANHGAPVPGAAVKVRVRPRPAASPAAGGPQAGQAPTVQTSAGPAVEAVLHDDGRHDDGAANDGVYGATVEKLSRGEYVAEATAEAGGRMRSASAAFKVGGGAPAKPPRPPAKAGRASRAGSS
jgi:pimeloyl-ACP methyl ester carboxylesterase